MAIIQTVPSIPNNSMSYDLVVWQGQAMIRRNIGSYIAAYSGGNLVSNQVTIGPNETVNFPACNNLFIGCNGLLTLTWGSSTFPIRQLLVLDSGLGSAWALTNTTSESVVCNLAYQVNTNSSAPVTAGGLLTSLG